MGRTVGERAAALCGKAGAPGALCGRTALLERVEVGADCDTAGALHERAGALSGKAGALHVRASALHVRAETLRVRADALRVRAGALGLVPQIRTHYNILSTVLAMSLHVSIYGEVCPPPFPALFSTALSWYS